MTKQGKHRCNGWDKKRNLPKKVPARISIEIPIPALSTNKMYSGRKRRSVYYKAFRKKVFQYLDDNVCKRVNLNGNLGLKMEVGFSSPLSDLSNAIKGIEDIMTEYLGFNDRQIVYIEMKKVLVCKGEEYISLIIYKTNREVDRRVNGKKTR